MRGVARVNLSATGGPCSMSAAPTAMGAPRNFSREGQSLGVMASAERESISPRVCWWSPSGVQGQSPWSGAQQEAKLPEAESFEAICTPKESPKICCQYAKTV